MSTDQDQNQSNDNKNPSWEATALMHIATASLREQKIARRWRLLVLFLFFALIFYGISSSPLEQLSKGSQTFISSSSSDTYAEHVALVRLHGAFFGEPVPGVVRYGDTMKALKNAANSPLCKGILLSIDSPGGTVYDSNRMHDSIIEFRKENPSLPIMVVVRNVALSGGYYVSMAADKLYADKTSLVGSIGVIVPSFGFSDAIKEFKIERRVITSGPNKAILDPFSDFSPQHRARIQTIVDEMYGIFTQVVKDGRGDRLTGDEKEMFSGAFWVASRSLELGLIDGIGTASDVAEQEFNLSNVVDYTIELDPFEQFFKGQITGNPLNPSSINSASFFSEFAKFLSPYQPYYLAW